MKPFYKVSYLLESKYKKCYIPRMNIYAAAALCLLPSVIAFVAIWRVCKIKVLVLLLCVLLAIVIVVPVSFVESFALRHLQEICRGAKRPFFALLFSVLTVGLIEETSKSLTLLALPIKRCKLTDSGFMLCALLFGLSLGCFESMAYFLDAIGRASNIGSTPVYTSIFCRIFTSDAMHTFCAMLGGIFILSIKKEYSHSQVTPPTDIMAIVWAVILHGIYDFLVAVPHRQLFALSAILLTAVQCNAHYKKLNFQNNVGNQSSKERDKN